MVLAGVVTALLVAMWLGRCRHEHERFTRNADGRRTFTCNRCGRHRASPV